MSELGTSVPVGGCGGRWVLVILFILDRLSTIKCKEIRYHQTENGVVGIELVSWEDLFRDGGWYITKMKVV